jgi:NAD(P)H-hydrate epimerase
MVRLTRAQVREVDRRAIEEYHIPGIVLMENAARAVADVVRGELMALTGGVGRVAVVCGGGNNGGDGFAIARHLHNAGAEVLVMHLSEPERLRGDALINFHIVRAMNLRRERYDSGRNFRMFCPNVIVDAVFGTGLEQPPRDPIDDFVVAVALERRTYSTKAIAVDLPSGLDCDTGSPLGKTVQADKTVTFVAEKAGFANPESRQYTGEVIVGDIGCPRELIEEVARAVG